MEKRLGYNLGRTALRAAMEDAVTDDLLAANAVAKVKRPSIRKQEAPCLTTAEPAALLAAAESSRYEDVLRLIVLTGLRRGEALGLKWEHVNFDRAELKVRGGGDGTKTPASWRTVSLSASVVALLKSRKAAQAAERLRAANVWCESGYVFTTATGTPVDPRNLLRVLKVAAQRAGLTDRVNIHTLRHTYATTALLAGVPIHVVSRNLGHASLAITADIYGHVPDDASRSASEAVSLALEL